MKLGDMTLKQALEYCNSHACYMCQFKTKKDNCIFHFRDLESFKNLNFDAEVDNNKKSLIEMNLDEVGELCAGRHQECADKTDWETTCPFYDTEEKICILQRRPFAWTTRINEMEGLEKLYKNMKGK